MISLLWLVLAYWCFTCWMCHDLLHFHFLVLTRQMMFAAVTANRRRTLLVTCSIFMSEVYLEKARPVISDSRAVVSRHKESGFETL